MMTSLDVWWRTLCCQLVREVHWETRENRIQPHELLDRRSGKKAGWARVAARQTPRRHGSGDLRPGKQQHQSRQACFHAIVPAIVRRLHSYRRKDSTQGAGICRYLDRSESVAQISAPVSRITTTTWWSPVQWGEIRRYGTGSFIPQIATHIQ